jgi:hypothetical protein
MCHDGIWVNGIEPLNILNKQTRKSDSGWSSNLEFEGGVNSSLFKTGMVENATQDYGFGGLLITQ